MVYYMIALDLYQRRYDQRNFFLSQYTMCPYTFYYVRRYSLALPNLSSLGPETSSTSRKVLKQFERVLKKSRSTLTFLKSLDVFLVLLKEFWKSPKHDWEILKNLETSVELPESVTTLPSNISLAFCEFLEDPRSVATRFVRTFSYSIFQIDTMHVDRQNLY